MYTLLKKIDCGVNMEAEFFDGKRIRRFTAWY
jgi:hypothetical protein